MGLLSSRVKSAFSILRGQPLDGYPYPAVAQNPVQFWQRGLDLNKSANGAVSAVESCIDAYVHAVAQMASAHYRIEDDGGKRRVTTSALSRILRSPNGYQTWSDFTTQLVRQLLSTGNFYAVATRNDRSEVDALHPMFSSSISTVIDTESKSVFYVTRSHELAPWSEAQHIIPARDVLHVRLYAPRHPLEGVSPITYAASAIAANSAISNHQATFFNNMSRPSFLLHTDLPLTPAQMKQLREAWNDQSVSMASGGVPILANGLKAQTLSLTSQDAQLVEAFKMTIEDIARAFRVPGQLVGLPGTYASTEHLISFWLSTGLGYLVNHIEQSIDRFFNLPLGEFTEFDTDTLLRVDLKSHLDALATATQNGIMSPNEARVRLDLPKADYGDEPRMQAQCVPLSAAELVPAAPTAPSAPSVNAPAAPPEDPVDEVEQPAKFVDTEIVEALMNDVLRKMRTAA